jgi:twitching motility protein PilJ
MKQNNVSLFGQLLLWQKFVILGVIAVILVILPFGFYLFGANNDIDVVNQEIQGIKPVGTLISITQLTQEHRSLSSLVLAGDKTNISGLETKAKEIAAVIAQMDELYKMEGNVLAALKIGRLLKMSGKPLLTTSKMPN